MNTTIALRSTYMTGSRFVCQMPARERPHPQAGKRQRGSGDDHGLGRGAISGDTGESQANYCTLSLSQTLF